MSAAKHTPGPWENTGKLESASCSTQFIPVFAGQKEVAQANARCDLSHDEIEANALLIAAAPLLLDTLKMVLAIVVMDSRDRAIVKAAINEATGEQA